MSNTNANFIDLNPSFDLNPISGDVFTLKNVNSLLFAIKSCLLTNHYERPFTPEFGSGIRSYLFDQIDSVTSFSIRKDILQTLKNFESRVDVKDVIVQANAEENRYDIYIQFFMVNNPSPIAINFFLERTR